MELKAGDISTGLRPDTAGRRAGRQPKGILKPSEATALLNSFRSTPDKHKTLHGIEGR